MFSKIIVLCFMFFLIGKGKETQEEKIYYQRRKACRQRTCFNYGYYEEACIRLCMFEQCYHQVNKIFEPGQLSKIDSTSFFKTCYLNSLKNPKTAPLQQ